MFELQVDYIYLSVAIITMFAGFGSAIQNAKLAEIMEKPTLRRYFLYYALFISLVILLFESFAAQLIIPSILISYSLRLIHLFVIIALYSTSMTLLEYSRTTLSPQSNWIKPLMQIACVLYLASLIITAPYIGTTNRYYELFYVIPSIAITVVLLYYVFRSTAKRINNVYLSELIKNQGNLATGALVIIALGAIIETYTQNEVIQIIFVSITLIVIAIMALITAKTNSCINEFKNNNWQRQLLEADI